MLEELLDSLTHELGEIYCCEEECPGVYYIATYVNADEYYIVLEDAPISQETRAMGRFLKDVPAWAYVLDTEDGAYAAVKYEVLKYLTAHKLPLPEGTSLLDAALFGMDHLPDYFGAYPVPFLTPWGYTLRHRPLDNGIYWIETDQCVQVLAVCYPIWAGELSEQLQAMGEKLDAEGELGYIYFLMEAACVIVWELLRIRPTLFDTGMVRKPELMNAIWEHHPEYAMSWNAQEQAGLHDALGLILNALGGETQDLKGSPEHMIKMTPNTGTDFIGFWR